MFDIWTILNPINILDIAIVAIFIYGLMKMVQGTRAVQLIRGLIVLLVFSGISSLLNLTTVNWILGMVRTMILIAIPIVFQPELRQFLARLGSSSFSLVEARKTNMTEVNAIVEQIVPFMADASNTKTGALIAIQREMGLNEYINTGIAIDGKLSKQLLGNIFIKNTPLHDGAVILQGNTIAAASCYLPLSERRDINKSLGTRHRAAIGLSELSDAVVCIVSEETGAMSIAVDGNLHFHLSEDQLRKELMEYLQRETPETLFQKWRGKV